MLFFGGPALESAGVVAFLCLRPGIEKAVRCEDVCPVAIRILALNICLNMCRVYGVYRCIKVSSYLKVLGVTVVEIAGGRATTETVSKLPTVAAIPVT